MPNRNIFETANRVPAPTVHNAAGGTAYQHTAEIELAQYAVTGCFNNTYYTNAKTDLARVKALCDKCSSEWIAKVAVYARQYGLMKDVPAFLIAYLSTRQEKNLFHAAFRYVINNIGMARSFVQIIRSGATGRKSLGSAPKRALRNLLATMQPEKIFWQCAGANPTIQDVLRLVHPKPATKEHQALFAYLLEREYDFAALPQSVQDFETFKQDTSNKVPAVDFRRLSTLNLSPEQWVGIASNMSWNQLRLNLNTLGRHGVFANAEATETVASKLRNASLVARSNCLPFAMYSTTQHMDSNLPASVRNAMREALELSVLNAPTLPGKTLVLVDISGSMSCAATGIRRGSTSTLRCSDVASYFAAALLKANPDNVDVQRFNTQVVTTNINPFDSVDTITNTLSEHSGGTAIGSGIHWARTNQKRYDTIIVISDNESWADRKWGYGWGGYGTPPSTQGTAAEEFDKYKRQINRNAKLVMWDICPSPHTQVAGRAALHVGGFSDKVFEVIQHFATKQDNNTWQNIINSVRL